MNPAARVYIAGHTGLVGSAIHRALVSRGYSAIITRTLEELDLTRQSAVESFFAAEQPEYVFLAAARVGGIIANSTYSADFIYDNAAIALNVIHAAHASGVKKLLNLGSSCIYPKLAPQPLKEEYLLTGPLESTNEAYAIAKIAAIKLCRYYNQQYQTDYLSVMPTNMYGEGDNYNLETSHVLPSLIRKFHLARLIADRRFDELMKDLRQRPLGFGIDLSSPSSTPEQAVHALSAIGVSAEMVTLWGTGQPFREFLYADDLADAVIFLMERYAARDVGEMINIGTGTDVRIAELAGDIARIVGYRGAIRFDSSKPDGTPRKLLDVSRLKALGWTPSVTLGDGIRRAYASYVKSQR